MLWTETKYAESVRVICPRQFATALDIEEKLNNVELRSEL